MQRSCDAAVDEAVDPRQVEVVELGECRRSRRAPGPRARRSRSAAMREAPSRSIEPRTVRIPPVWAMQPPVLSGTRYQWVRGPRLKAGSGRSTGGSVPSACVSAPLSMTPSLAIGVAAVRFVVARGGADVSGGRFGITRAGSSAQFAPRAPRPGAPRLCRRSDPRRPRALGSGVGVGVGVGSWGWRWSWRRGDGAVRVRCSRPPGCVPVQAGMTPAHAANSWSVQNDALGSDTCGPGCRCR